MSLATSAIGTKLKCRPVQRMSADDEDSVAKLVGVRLKSLVVGFNQPRCLRSPLFRLQCPFGRLCWASCLQRCGGTVEKFGEPPQVLRGCCKQYFVPDAAQAPQAEPVEPENALHVRKSHLNLLALAARLFEGFCIGQGADTITHIFVKIAGNFAHGRRRALRLQ